MIIPAELVPHEEIQRRLGISESTMYRGFQAGDIPGARRIGGRWITVRAVFERWLVAGIEPDAQAEAAAQRADPCIRKNLRVVPEVG